MRMTPKLIKYADRIAQKNPIEFDDDRAMAEFRSFAIIAEVQIDRFSEVSTLDVAIEVVGNLQNQLMTRKKALNV